MSKYLILVKGKNIRNFLLKIDKKKINILNICFVNDNEIKILIKKEEFYLLNEIKGIYEYDIIKEYGINNIKKHILKNLHLLILLFINIALLYVISNYVYEIEIITKDESLKKFVSNILEEKNIKKFNKKTHNLDSLKTEIINENKDKIEWIEIIESGVKYIVKVEEKIKNKPNNDDYPTDIIARKDGTIKKIVASSGKILVEKETYVKKGDTLITGIIDENNFVRSKGEVYADIWYKVKAVVSQHENSYSLTNNKKTGFKIKLFDKKIPFYKNYKTSLIEEKIIFKNQLLPVYLLKDEITETIIVDNILTIEEAENKALSKARQEIEKNLKNNEKIISENQLKLYEKDSKIIVEVLYIVRENISEERRIEVSNVQEYNRSSN